MNPEPLISIVLPTYNGQKYLAESLDSILAQTHQNWELIIVDDCSTDSTPDIIKRYEAKDPRIRSIRNKENLHIARSLNAGFAVSKGSYLTWTSDDNYYFPEALAAMLEFLKQNENVHFVYAGWNRIDATGKLLKVTVPEPSEKLAVYCIVGPCFLYKRVVYETIGAYNPKWLLLQDYEYWLRCWKHFNLAPFNRVLYAYRDHADSLSETQKAKFAYETNDIQFEYPQLLPFPSKYKSKALIVHFLNSRHLENPPLRLDLLWKAFRYSPTYFLRSLPKILFNGLPKILFRKLLSFKK